MSSAVRTRGKDPVDHEPQAVTFAREKAGLTMTQLAGLAGCSVSLISEIESGNRNATPAMIAKLAEALNCPRVVLERKRGKSWSTRGDEPSPVYGPCTLREGER